MLWLMTRFDLIDRWSFVAALLVFVLAAVPLMPLLFAPPEVAGRRFATAMWVGTCVVISAFVPWATLISSNGWRALAILIWVVLVIRTAIGIHGAVPDIGVAPAPSPDLLGIDRPLTHADALDAGRALGLDEEIFDQFVSTQASAAHRPQGAVK